MKYIRGQDGGIYSVARLKPPCRMMPEGEPIWRMSVITADGEQCYYATFSTEAYAVKVYSYVWQFMESRANMLTFDLGSDGWFRHIPSVIEAPPTITNCVAVGHGAIPTPVVDSIDEIKQALDENYMSHREMLGNMLRRVFRRRKGEQNDD